MTNNSTYLNSEILGIIITKETVGNMNLEHIHVSNGAIQLILKSIKLNEEAQLEIVDKLVDRSPNWSTLSQEEQINKIKTILTQETVIEYLRFNGDIRQDVNMLEAGIDKEGSIIVTAFYIKDDEQIEKVLYPELTEEQVNAMEREINILSNDMNLLEVAQKQLNEKIQKGEIIDFTKAKMNREQRRAAKKMNK